MDVQIFRQRVVDLFDYDAAEGRLFWKVSRGKAVAGQEAGSRSNGYLNVKIDQKAYGIHRLIFLIENGYLPDYIDHINGIRDDNRITNLRGCSQRENCRNKAMMSNNTSGIVGVYWNKAANKWHAYCRDRNGKKAFIGLFTNKHFAGEAVRKFRLEHHGEFTKDHWITVDPDAIKFLAIKLKKPAG